MPSPKNTAHVLIDTNIALHYKRLDQIDWKQLASADRVVLVIAPVLVKELEKHKATNPSRKIRARADGIVKWMEKFDFRGKDSIRTGVSLHFIDHEPRIDYKSYDLSRDVADDRLIASAIDYCSQHSLDQSVFIATGDLGLKIKVAAREGIETLKLSDDLRLQPEPDNLEAENKKLRQRVASLESHIPKLSVAFEGGESKQELFFSKPVMKGVMSPLQIRAKYPLMDGSSQRNYSIESVISRFSSSIYSDDRLKEYYESYDKYYADRLAYEEEMSLCFWLQLVISNDGTAPASNIDLYLHLPDGVKAIDDTPDKPKCPSPPDKLSMFHHGVGELPTIPTPWLNNNGKPRVEDNGSTVRISVDNLKHSFNFTCDYITLRFRDWESIKSFGMNFSISANEMPVATEGTLHVIAKVRDKQAQPSNNENSAQPKSSEDASTLPPAQ